MTENAQDKARQAVETVVKSPELVEQILSDEYVQIMIARCFHSGPLPPPSDLAQYNDIISNGADRIMAMAEKNKPSGTKPYGKTKPSTGAGNCTASSAPS